MQAIILNLHKDLTLYNGETTTDRIIRLLNENNISYTISNTLPSNITKPTIIIENNLIFNNQLLHNYLNTEETINLLELNKHNTYRITNNYNNTYINTINDNNKDILNKELRIYDLCNQQIITTEDYYNTLKDIINKNEPVFIVSSKSMTHNISNKISNITKNYIVFNDYHPNPSYEDIIKGKELFINSKSNTIIAIGGGSTIDTAKCIKAFTNIKDEQDIINKNYKYSPIKLIAIPTTSGTGSESTEVAIMYYKGEKLSVDHPSDLPNYAILDHNLLKSVPDYQKKCTMLDALCQSIEAIWSKNRTSLSKKYSKQSIKLIIDNYQAYLDNDDNSLKAIQLAANLSGRAITLAKTTAPHTMCYRLTTKYNIAHGHAVSLNLISNWKLINERKDDNTKLMLEELSNIIGTDTIEESINKIDNLIKSLRLQNPNLKENEIDYLVDGVDLNRLSNHPIKLDKKDLYNIYLSIINQ